MKKIGPKNGHFELRFYDGYKGEEKPRSVVIGNREFEIEKILERKRELEERTGKTRDVYICEMEGNKVRITVLESGNFEIVFLKSYIRSQ